MTSSCALQARNHELFNLDFVLCFNLNHVQPGFWKMLIFNYKYILPCSHP